jgi:WhiB family redox-sensing transcriptional regulator
MSRKPNGRKLRPREQQAIDAQKLFAHLTHDGSLWDGALCAGSEYPNWWFPEVGNAITNEEIIITGMALEICDACPIRDQCLEVGMQDDDIRFGIWGGMLAGERLALRNKLTGKRATEFERSAISGARMVRARISKLNGVKL